MSEQNSVQCPVCGSHDVAISHEAQNHTVPFAGAIELQMEVATCRTCGERGDFRNVNSAVMKQAIEVADHQSISSILEWMSVSGYSMAYIERALRLPTRTIARWKSGECSASGIALLRLVRTYPWLLEVAGEGFSDLHARQAVLRAASTLIEAAVDAAGLQYSVSAAQPDMGSVELRARLEPKRIDTSTATDDLTSSFELRSLAA